MTALTNTSVYDNYYGLTSNLETENAKLKRMYADFALENAAIEDVLDRDL